MNERKITSSTESTRSLGKYYLVSGVPLFRFLNPADRSFVANRCRLDEYNAEELIYRAGEPCDFLYILVSGSVTLEHSATNGDFAEIRGNHHDVLRKGDYFGIVFRQVSSSSRLSVTRSSKGCMQARPAPGYVCAVSGR